MSNLSGLNNKYDAIFSSLAVHYIENFSLFVSSVNGFLSDGGYFIFSQEHPLTTAPTQGASWTKDDNQNILHYNLTDYAKSGKRSTTWIVDNVIKYHRTFSEIVNTLIINGFTIEKILEPIPTDEIIRRLPYYEKRLHKPDFLVIRAKKG